jgi:predicted KAP-like P-loop ATPase
MYSDNETGTDLLGFEDQVDELCAVVTDQSVLPVTVGVLGDWGSGKSSLLRMAATRLRSQSALVIEFSPWRIESYDDAKTALLTAVLQQLEGSFPEPDVDQSKLERCRDALGQLLRRVRWMRVAGLAAKHLASIFHGERWRSVSGSSAAVGV